MSGPPAKIRIAHDNYQASHVGHTASGDQFILTHPFVPPRREFLAVYLFHPDGRFKEARIDDLGSDNTVGRQLFERRVEELGPIEYGDIEVSLFRIERYGVEFGLIPRPPEDEEDERWWVVLQPGDYMAFTEPFDGSYDT